MYTRDTCQVFKFIEMFQENRFSCRETVPYKQFENLEDDQKSKFHVDEKDVDEVLDATDTSAIIPQNSGQQRIYSKRWDYFVLLYTTAICIYKLEPKSTFKIQMMHPKFCFHLFCNYLTYWGTHFNYIRNKYWNIQEA